MAFSCPLTIETYLGSAWGVNKFQILPSENIKENPKKSPRINSVFFQFSGEIVAFQKKKDKNDIKKKSDGRVYSEKLSSEG
jgi:hypothetical protein